MVQDTSSTATARRNRRQIEQDNDANNTFPAKEINNKTTTGFLASNFKHRSGRFDLVVRCVGSILSGRSATANTNHQRRRSCSFAIVRRVFIVFCFVSTYWMVYNRLGEIEGRYDVETSPKHHTASHKPGGKHLPAESSNNSDKNKESKSLADYLIVQTVSNDLTLDHPSLEKSLKGREYLVSILEDAGIDHLDAQDVLRLPLWSSVTNLYYNGNSGSSSKTGPIVLGLDSCAKFRERFSPGERFLGVAGNFNSGTTAFGISLQKNCRIPNHRPDKNFVIRKRREIFASNVNGMLSMVPWAKHKHADFRHNHTISPPYKIDHEAVLPIVVVRDPFYWMQSMCKEGYGVRWDHDSNHHCPNLIPNDFDKERFPALSSDMPVPVWMGANPTAGPTWPSLIHYWNNWYESYFDNIADESWPRLMIRFEDTLFYPKQVMEEVCHCGGGTLLEEHDYSLEEAKPEHKHEQKNNFVTAMIEYGTNATRLHNMTQQDVNFAIQNLNPTLMKTFGYSYPNANS